MALSTKNLFHYTNLSALKGILAEGFRFNEVKEELPIIYQASDDPLLRIPDLVRHEFPWQIISFCDILLSQIEDHRKQYGSFAIGLSKDWAISKGVTPVQYVHHYTPYRMELFNNAKDELLEMNKHGGILPYFVKALKDLNHIPKDYDGTALKNLDAHSIRIIQELLGSIVDKIRLLYMSGAYLKRYGDTSIADEPPFVETTTTYYDEKEWRAASFEHKPENLKFQWKDISHIILETQEKKEEVAQYLETLRISLVIDENENVRDKLRLYSDDLTEA